ncbi:alpha-esterase 49 precursor [Bombyx mori]|uniref:Carboxylic ester hydrolase n=1 Tax=Bombyx mori TaxID=7091 RepID=B3GEF6_BOMMO|nr:alpha-esterase 49 precursor [Bombyx mori]ACD80422.1 carboxylesterase CarE-13 [Bombyx mori]
MSARRRVLVAVQILLYLVNESQGLARIDPLVETELGLIKGLRANDGDYAMFLGIPFGKVNASNPFGDATAYGKFDGVLEAYDDSAICPQIDEATGVYIGTIDCLHLNVYVPPSATSKNPVPVMVYIYGGSFRHGDFGRHVYGPKFLVKHDVILVTLNYRLGPYGFMCLDIPEVPGNQGFKDQLLALKWVKEHIHNFGGDSNKITVSGESAGAIAVDFHLMYNKEKLFHKAIIQSGTTLSPVFYEPSRNAPILIAEKLGYITDDLNAAITFLAQVDPSLVIAAVFDLGIELNVRPCVEKSFEGVERFIDQNWITADVRNARDVQALIGLNEHERLIIHASGDNDYFKNLNVVETKLFDAFDVDNDKFNGMKDIVQHFYFGDDEVTIESKLDVVNFDSDIMYNHPSYRSIDRFIENNSGDIFLYLFSYVGGRNYVRVRDNITVGGAVHADELGYLFDISYLNIETDDADVRMVDVMTTLWTNFVKYGNPTPEVTELIPVKWTPIVDTKTKPFLNLGKELTVGSRPFSERMAFWDLFYKANKELQRAYPGENI